MSSPSGNRRIAKNTAFTYLKLFTSLLVGLYTSRIVLQVLGVSDLGIYSVVAGVLSLFSFIQSALKTGTSRFFNIEMGKQDGDLNRSFNVNVAMHASLALLVLLLAETAGLWYVNNILSVEAGKLADARFVFQISIVTTCLGIVNTPYVSLLSAYEEFKFISIVDIVNIFVKLILVVLLLFYKGNYALRLYSIIMCLTAINSFMVFHIYARRKWRQVIRIKPVFQWNYYKEILGFSNWNLLATLSFVFRSSGSDILINSFFGTATNGAFSIGKQVNDIVSQFSNNFNAVSGPQITQSYSSGDSDRCVYLVNKLGRFCLLLFEIIFFPLYIELNYVLTLWLGNVPEGALSFCQVYLLITGVSLTGSGIVQYIMATGKIKWFEIQCSILMILCFPLGYVLFKLGLPANSILYCFLIADILQRIIQLILMKTLLKFDSWKYVKEAYTRPFIIAVILTVLMMVYWQFRESLDINRLLVIGIFGVVTILFVYCLGFTKGERNKINCRIKEFLKI